MLNILKRVVGVVAVLLVGGLASAQTPIAVTVETLVGTYDDNELRGDQRFRGQLVRVTGVVTDIARTISDTPYIKLVGGEGLLGGLRALAALVNPDSLSNPDTFSRGLTCTLASDAVGGATQLSIGQNVTLEGVVDGLFVDVQMSDCRVAVEAMAERRVADAEGAEVRAARARIAEVVARAADARAEARVLSPETEPRLRDWNAGALQSQVDESRARLAALAAPLPAPYQCPATAPKTEFETSVAFDARLASAQQACSDNTRHNEQELQTERTRRAAMTDTPLTLPLWNAMAQYDADREVFLVNLLQAPDDRYLTLGIAPDRSVSARADDVLPVYAGRAWVCAIPVSLADAPTWRTSTSLLLSFRLASPSIDAPLSVADAGLLRVEQGVARLAATSLTECVSEMPAGYQGVALVDPQVAVEAAAGAAAAAERRVAEAEVEAAASPVTEGGTTNRLLFDTQTPTYGSVELTAGFNPDPYTIEVTGGVEVDASSLGGECAGYTAEAPDFRLSWSGASAQLRIFFNAPGGEDPTLVVHLPGRLGMLCNDDADGVFLGNPLDPEVRLSNPPEGQYEIWVGSWTGERISGTLSISER